VSRKVLLKENHTNRVFVEVDVKKGLTTVFLRSNQHRPGNCLKVAYYSVKLNAKNLFLVISRTVLRDFRAFHSSVFPRHIRPSFCPCATSSE
jgi:hypothetical protein